jgi:23S rRNA (uracil1939-C5)-methyltransferase
MNVLCRHFGTCGGCAYQDMTDETYRALKRDLVVHALSREGFADAQIDEVVEVGPATRRRATFKVAKIDGVTSIGFHAAKSHAIVDMHECRVLTPALTALAPRLRAMMATLLPEGGKAEVHVTEADSGFDVSLRGLRANAKLVTHAAKWAAQLQLARMTADGEILIELASPTVTLGSARLHLPSQCFLQPTRDGEKLLQDRVLEATAGSRNIADLFCGCGTFALPLAAKARVYGVDSDGPALAALEEAARTTQKLKPVNVERRDLFKQPLSAAELARFDAVVLDPPRIGAAAQAKELARAKVRRIAYVSCNPESFARDARLLTTGGFRLGTVTPVDQFLWSSHIELVACFSRDS